MFLELLVLGFCSGCFVGDMDKRFQGGRWAPKVGVVL